MAEDLSEPRLAGRPSQSAEGLRAFPAEHDEGGSTGGLGGIMSAVACSLRLEHADVESTLQAITATAVGTVPGADAASIIYVVARRRLEPRARTGDMSRLTDDVQDRVGEGPCLDALWEHKIVRIADMLTETRWPRFTPEAVLVGARSSLSFRLFIENDSLGALNLYGHAPHAFGDESEDVGSLFASHAAIALAGAQTEERLREAVASRDRIGQAKGILMERFKVTADQAFALLARASQVTNRKLVDIANELCETGALPPADGRLG
jgi:GAF domain-containing protein